MPHTVRRPLSPSETRFDRRVQSEGLHFNLSRLEREWWDPEMRERAIKQLTALAVELLELGDTAVVCFSEEDQRRELPGDCEGASQVLYFGHRRRGSAEQFMATLRVRGGSVAEADANRIAAPATTRGFLDALHHAIKIAQGARPVEGFDRIEAQSFRDEFIRRMLHLAKSDATAFLQLTDVEAWQPWTAPQAPATRVPAKGRSLAVPACGSVPDKPRPRDPGVGDGEAAGKFPARKAPADDHSAEAPSWLIGSAARRFVANARARIALFSPRPSLASARHRPSSDAPARPRPKTTHPAGSRR
ncbi:hypothetical protein [Roseateles noduli]|uniref:hypothetical protein n=1 Tax=Roseateles noduli TaxID=2052484 RepID=UPI003D65EFCE